MSMAQVQTREIAIPPYLLGGFDPSLFKPTPEEWAVLRSTISSDEEEIKKRVFAVQSKAYAVHPYPCIRAFHFISIMMSTNPIYPVILEEAQKNADAIFLDLGCCMGTDVRKLALDGFPASQIVGCDLRREFIDSGYTLFGDRASCDISFFTDDIFELSPQSTPSAKPSSLSLKDATGLKDLQGRVSYIYTGALFHLFDEESQPVLATRLASLLRVPPGASLGDPPVGGCVMFGGQQGNRVPAVLDDYLGRTRFGHNLETWADMWRGVFEERYGRDFVTNRLQVQSNFKELDYGNGSHEYIFWSVRIV